MGFSHGDLEAVKPHETQPLPNPLSNPFTHPSGARTAHVLKVPGNLLGPSHEKVLHVFSCLLSLRSF